MKAQKKVESGAHPARVSVQKRDANLGTHTPEERQGPDYMEDLAQKTGGELIPLQSMEWFTKPEAASLAKSLREQVAAPNRMELQLTTPLSRPAKLSITPAREPKAYTIVYPRRLEPCSKSAGQ